MFGHGLTIPYKMTVFNVKDMLKAISFRVKIIQLGNDNSMFDWSLCLSDMGTWAWDCTLFRATRSADLIRLPN